MFVLKDAETLLFELVNVWDERLIGQTGAQFPSPPNNIR